MKAFKNYLKTKAYQVRTIKEDCNNIDRFLKWLKPETTESIEQLSTQDLVAYINALQAEQLNVNTINIRLRSIRKYFDYLKSEDRVKKNIAENLKIKGATKKVIIDPLEHSELEQLYKDYLTYLDSRPIREAKQIRTNLRKKVVVGFILFQGLHTGELEKLEVNHINQMEGTIYIPSGAKHQSRTLKINPFQFVFLFSYLSTLKEEQASLFDFGMRNQVAVIIGELRGLNERVQNIWHLRSSVVMHLLKLHGKRQTQYMIGHKWISSTEFFELQDLETLTNQLEKHHPLRGDY